MNPVLNGNGEIPLLSEDPRITAIDNLEQWQVDQLASPSIENVITSVNHCLAIVDSIVAQWLQNLSNEQWTKIKRQKSLFGIPLPDDWIKVWRFVIKEPTLHDSEGATQAGKNVGSFVHLWNLRTEDCIDKYTNKLEKELLNMVSQGYLYSEIGEILLEKYGDEFWKPRKADSKTTPSQVVNNYLYWKIPNKIARAELTDIVLSKLKMRTSN